MDECKIRGPYYPVGDVDWICETHDSMVELADRSKPMSKKNARCPVANGETPYTDGDWKVVS